MADFRDDPLEVTVHPTTGIEMPFQVLDPMKMVDPTHTNYTAPPDKPQGSDDILASFGMGIYNGNLALGPTVRALQLGLDRMQNNFPEEPGYDLLKDEQVDAYPDLLPGLMTSRSTAETKKRLGVMLSEMAIANNAPAWNMFGNVMGAMVDPIWASTMLAGGIPRVASLLRAGHVTADLLGGGRGYLAAQMGAAGFASEGVRAILDPNNVTPEGLLLGVGIGAVGGVLVGHLNNLGRADFDRIAREMRAEQDFLDANTPNFQESTFESVGAAATQPGRLARSYAQKLHDEAAAHAFYLERMPNNAPKRVLQSVSLRARDLVTELLELPLFQNKNFLNQATRSSVERAINRGRATAVDVMKSMRSGYNDYAARTLGRDLNFAERHFQNRPGRGTDTRPMSYALFRREVTIARLNGNTHAIPEVAAEARAVGDRIYGPLGRRAADSGFFEDTVREELEALQRNRENHRDDGNFSVRNTRGDQVPKTAREMDEMIDAVQARLDAIIGRGHGGLRQNYVNRIYRRDRIKKHRSEFKQILMEAHPGMRPAEADEAIEAILHTRPYELAGPDSVGRASSVRHLELFAKEGDEMRLVGHGPNNIDFIETDILTVSRYYQRTFGADLELFERFGSVNMKQQINEVQTEYMNAIEKAQREGRLTEVADLRKEMEATLSDVRAMRDLVRGTYGLPVDPNRGISTAIRTVKRYNGLTMLTGAMAALPDAGRIVMAEGMSKTFNTVFEALSRDLSAIKWAHRDAQLSGEATDMFLSTRAALMADLSDGIGVAAAFETGLDKVSNFTFSYINLISPWTDGMKTISSLVSGSRMFDDIEAAIAHSGGVTVSPRLAKAGIGPEMAQRIWDEFQIHGQRGEHLRVAHLDAWTDLKAREVYEDALAREVSRTIVTPGLGDPPLWMNTEWGGLIAQFKKFSAGAFEQILVSGLQERKAAQLHGMVMMVAMGMMIDSIRRDQTDWGGDVSLLDRITSGIERSGVLGWVGDLVNAADTLTDSTASGSRVAGTVLGATGSQVANLFELAFNGLDGNPNTVAGHNVRRMLPLQNVFWLDGVFDQVSGGPRRVQNTEPAQAALEAQQAY